jgi:hypothetical protein
MSIFISIAAYRDKELLPTVKSIIDNAENPDDLYFGIVSQDMDKDHPDLSFVNNLSYLKMDFRKAKGAGYARKLAMEMYRGESFYLQLDSHMRAVKDWDTKLIDMYYQSTKLAGTDKVILSQYPAAYEIHTGGKEYFIQNHEELWSTPTWSRVHNRDNGSWSSVREKFEDLSQPHPSHTVLAGYLFAHGSFVEEIPYDERISFMGEELCIAIRSYTRGWKIYAPNEMLFWHFYKRRQSPKIWNQVEDTKREVKWIDMEMNSKRVQRSILLGEDHGIFGIGDYEKYIEYQEMIGINFSDFYQNEMHKKVNSGLKSQEIMFP